MKKIIAGFTTVVLAFTIAAPVFALSQSGAKDAWVQAQQVRLGADAAYRQAQLDYSKDKSPAEEQKLIDAAKALMNAALDEARAWLEWKRIESSEDARVPSDIKENINTDVENNLEKISGFRADVAGVTTRAETFVVFLKIVGGYAGLLADVARNTGAMWSSIGSQLVARAEDFEAKLRAVAADRPDLIPKLDIARSEVALAKSKVAMAKAAYLLVKLPGTPLIKFSEGNGYLREAQLNLVQAQIQMQSVFNSLVTE
ncbi:hypothetical protein A3E39_04675 [Candidatus Uhrbacteria bacterium RIFCSPHIGHO2_12_FULL_60_25]|uniref:DUF5667 domain-containing protein n=1 Tax=Candidatus Uhrbacteria bacterium RIFCSPHIGHO2_12_FULL_60_25 TaxID=1802399 RepID=A0A1F7UJ95_9BACT|nr:MAG: hypothetical protein A3D73_04020 [Candidatus Uhrbacteria bacterium RIFCSPHIGHO2_02_FULL_60_44]OGL78329.1 MAG: hypothetical protein A3E39_04675 [Candidatus Uhrbacteria bacterium RIFCSPHIGHO2_12_FULL_60_25]